MNQDTEVSYAPVTVEIRSSSSVKGAAPGVLVRATSKANGHDVEVATNLAWLAWENIQDRLAEGLTNQLKASIEKESQ